MDLNPLDIANGLKDLFFQIRQRATPCRYDAVRVRGETAFLDGIVPRDAQPAEILHPFQELRSIVDEHVRQAIFMYDAGMDALVLLYPFVNAILAGRLNSPVRRIEEVSVTVHTPALRLIDQTQPETENSFQKQHYFYKITWFDGSASAVDVTSAQFGHIYPVCPWYKIQLEWGLTMNDVFPLGHVRRVIYPNYGPAPDMLLVSGRLETLELSQYIADNLVNAPRLLNKEQRQQLIEELDKCVDGAMEELYSRNAIVERLKEVKSRLEVVNLDNMGNTTEGSSLVAENEQQSKGG